MIRTCLIVMIGLAVLAPGTARAGESAGVLSAYCMGGSALGSLVGSAAATVAYFNDKQGFDFLVGAGGGAMAGCGMGVLLGILDLAARRNKPAACLPEHFPVVALRPGGAVVGLNVTF